MRQLSRMCRTVIFLLAVLVAAAGNSQAAYVITTAGQRVDGSDIRAKSDGEIILTTVQGTRSFYPGQYAKAVADKPAEIDKAAQLIEAKQFDEAAKLLEDVILRYRLLDWDNQARAMLERDVDNMRNYYGMYAPELLKTRYAREMWSLFEDGKLGPETELTGLFEESREAIDLDGVLHEIESAQEEAMARRARLQAEQEEES